MNNKIQQITSLRQTQELSLKPQMIQSLKMLTLPMLELETLLKQEIIDNPMLEMKEDWEEDNEEKQEIEANDNDEIKETLQEAKELSEILDSWNEFHSDSQVRSASTESEDDTKYEDFLQVEDNYKLDFINQFDKYRLQDFEYNFIYDLIDNSNAYGFLPSDFDIYALAFEYNIDSQIADELHTLVLRTFPRGITARSINECLYNQLEEYELNDKLLTSIILEDFDLLIHRKYSQLAKKYDVSENDIISCRDRIAKLDPKPGMRLNSGKPQYIVPDLIVIKIENDFEIIINDFNIPKISLSRSYQSILSKMGKNKEAVTYVKNKINSAKFLIKSVFLRNRTLERVMRSIINHQKNFFYNSSGTLDPLTYAVIADDLGVNESTISRVVNSKYVDTQFGIFGLKDFFCSTAGKDKNYEAVSRQNVQQQIEKLINDEDPSNTLSDQEIVDILKERGISVSRRVIAKYRDELQIPNSRLRRK
ncbi:MAG: RNA polymerase factor sigma-54 [Candidatus Cloacimonetes bacterium]|jgi:RNA polymerase sigma-54 factor|nr:RNA polymerase factor sigma-54 [Candidatus Cloacimonadota bacterium]MDD4155332.1 RNA polymerase factor sigma-54 [Candidatus Cloacimonadota bacterium]